MLPASSGRTRPDIRGSRFTKTWKIIWKYGGPFERFFEIWIFSGSVVAILTLVAALAYGENPDWPRLPLVGNSVVFTFLPAMWAFESSSTIRGMLQAGLEHPEIARLKIEYLERFGHGGNGVARMWASTFVVVYIAWFVAGIWLLPAVGIRDLLIVVVLDAVLVFGLPVMVTLRARRYYGLAESRGYPIVKLALRLKEEGVRS